MSLFFSVCLVLFFETKSYNVLQAGLELLVFPLQPLAGSVITGVYYHAWLSGILFCLPLKTLLIMFVCLTKW